MSLEKHLDELTNYKTIKLIHDMSRGGMPIEVINRTVLQMVLDIHTYAKNNEITEQDERFYAKFFNSLESIFDNKQN